MTARWHRAARDFPCGRNLICVRMAFFGETMIRLGNATTRLVSTIAVAMVALITASCGGHNTERRDETAVQQATGSAVLAPDEALPEPTPLDVSKVSADEFPGPWGEVGFRDVAITLGRSQIRGCGEFATRRQRNEPNRFLVYCTRDGENWTAHLVDVSTQQVQAVSPRPVDIANPY